MYFHKIYFCHTLSPHLLNFSQILPTPSTNFEFFVNLPPLSCSVSFSLKEIKSNKYSILSCPSIPGHGACPIVWLIYTKTLL